MLGEVGGARRIGSPASCTSEREWMSRCRRVGDILPGAKRNTEEIIVMYKNDEVGVYVEMGAVIMDSRPVEPARRLHCHVSE